ncbi:MAG TPA: biotin transporter BioY [Candidatus Xenobia bacterium]|nr:biotin transporter BioY [Candidatus Xenobia bacterium]
MRALTVAQSRPVLADALLPQATRAQNTLLVVAGSLLMALCSQISLPLPFSPVPVTGQTFAVLLLGATLGGRRSAAALILYLVEGVAGLPVFAPGGLPGAARLLGPTGGYLLAFPPAAFVLGTLLARLPKRWFYWLGAVLLAEALIFTAGVAWLKYLTLAGWSEAVRAGLLPFLPGELMKVALVSACLPASWWVVERARAH